MTERQYPISSFNRFTFLITSRCHSLVLWHILSRTTVIPPLANLSSASNEQHAGPTVQTSFVFLNPMNPFPLTSDSATTSSSILGKAGGKATTSETSGSVTSTTARTTFDPAGDLGDALPEKEMPAAGERGEAPKNADLERKARSLALLGGVGRRKEAGAAAEKAADMVEGEREEMALRGRW